jgi:mono/diheme cytochrome c family protein
LYSEKTLMPPMRKALLSLFVLALLLVFGGASWMGYELLTTGFSAKGDPHPFEIALVRQMRHFSIPSEIRNLANPVPMSPAVLAESLEHFADHCATCHANDGSGQTPIGRNVYPKAPDLRLKETQSMSDGELFFTIHNGIRFTAMPAWGEGTIDKDIGSWKLVHFIRHLPQVTQEELDRMKALNPRTKHQREAEALHDNSPHGGAPSATSSDGGHHH